MALRSISNSFFVPQHLQKKLDAGDSVATVQRSSEGINGCFAQLPSFANFPVFNEGKKLCVKASNPAIYSLFQETLMLVSKEKGEVRDEVVTEETLPRKLLMEIRSLIPKIFNPICRCEKLIKVIEEYTLLEDVTYEDQKNAETALAEAIAILNNEIADPNAKATLWLRIFECCKEIEVQYKSNRKKAFLDEARNLLTREVGDASTTAKLWLTTSNKYKENSFFAETLKQKKDILMDLSQDVKDRYTYCTVLVEISYTYEEEGDERNVLRTLEEVVEVAGLIPDFDKKMHILIDASRRYGDIAFSMDALVVLEKALAYITTLKDRGPKKLNFLRRIALECEAYRAIKECEIFLKKIKVVICKIASPSIFFLLKSCLSLNLKDKLEAGFIDYEASKSELLMKIHFIISKIIDSAERCQKLIELSKEYASLKEDDNAQAVLAEALVILENDIEDPNMKGMMWLMVLERYKEEEFRWVEKKTEHKKNMKKAFLDESAAILKEDANDVRATTTSWITLFKKYQGLEEMHETRSSVALKRDMAILTKILPDVIDHYIRCKVLLKMSDIYEQQDNRGLASDKLKEVFEVAESIVDVSRKVEVMISMSQIYAKRDFLGDTLDILEEATQIVRAMEDDPQKLKLLDLLVEEYKKYRDLTPGYQSSERLEEHS